VGVRVGKPVGASVGDVVGKGVGGAIIVTLVLELVGGGGPAKLMIDDTAVATTVVNEVSAITSEVVDVTP